LTNENNKNLLRMNVRQMREFESGTGKHDPITQHLTWDPKKTALIICDMWDRHWCEGAASRVAEMAPRMNEVIKELRSQGVLIIHAPSATLEFYKDHPGRQLVQNASPIELELPLPSWVHFDSTKEGPFPIDDSDGGCDCEPRCQNGRPWSRQIETLEIMNGDAITDSAEAVFLMKERQIENVMIMGVHTNMCVLGRPFGIRQLVNQGMNVLLMRDMTDTMYNPKMSPFVDHFTGNDLVFCHIEKYWCPTVTSDQFIGGQPFHYQADTRKEKQIT
jgi:nicotinamidase-related amidase